MAASRGSPHTQTCSCSPTSPRRKRGRGVSSAPGQRGLAAGSRPPPPPSVVLAFVRSASAGLMALTPRVASPDPGRHLCSLAPALPGSCSLSALPWKVGSTVAPASEGCRGDLGKPWAPGPALGVAATRKRLQSPRGPRGKGKGAGGLPHEQTDQTCGTRGPTRAAASPYGSSLGLLCRSESPAGQCSVSAVTDDAPSVRLLPDTRYVTTSSRGGRDAPFAPSLSCAKGGLENLNERVGPRTAAACPDTPSPQPARHAPGEPSHPYTSCARRTRSSVHAGPSIPPPPEPCH